MAGSGSNSGKNSANNSRLSPLPSTPASHGSKLPRIFQNKARARAASVNEAAPLMSSSGSNNISIASGSSSSSISMISPVTETPSKHRPESRRSSKLRSLKEFREDNKLYESGTEATDREVNESMDETPVIIEPHVVSRHRSKSERPSGTSSSEPYPSVSYFPTAAGSQRFTDLPTRLSGWISHTFSSSTTDLSLASMIAQQHPVSMSPKTKASGLITAAKHGKEHLDKAMRYLLDSDSTPDKCADPIWLLGVEHTGYEPPERPPSTSPPIGRRSNDLKRSSSSLRSSTSSRASTKQPAELSLSQSQSGKHSALNWPPVFYADFTSRIWLTYRSHYTPIRDHSLASLDVDPSIACGQPSTPPRRWNWPGGGEKGWTSDSGWGCMLRTGQSLLANALIHLYLGRDWRRPPEPVMTADYATYVKILTWFFDSPDPLCPFGVHRMALAGKDVGKDVGQWFGPSTAAGAIKTLVASFPEAGLGVAVATDGVLYETDVLAASNAGPYRHNRVASPRRRQHQNHQQQQSASYWGQRAVLVLIGVRLGLDGVNPIYYDSVKALYKFPQSMGIAGGRPSSSYYFVGTQADNLFYLDPHHTRPTVPLRPPPRPSSRNQMPVDSPPSSYRERPGFKQSAYDSSSEHESILSHTQVRRSGQASSPLPVPPSPMGQRIPSQSSYASRSTPSPSVPDSSSWSVGDGLDPIQEHYATAYSSAELKTYHCDKVRKMPISGLDPSMLIGFLCRDERDWKDLRERIHDLFQRCKPIFTIQDEPPSWPSDSDDMGLESVSDVDIDMPAEDNEFSELTDDGDGETDFAEVRAQKRNEDESESSDGGVRKSNETETEEEPINPMTPSLGPTPNSRAPGSGAFSPVEDEDEDDSEWVDGSPSQHVRITASQLEPVAPKIMYSHSEAATNSHRLRERQRETEQHAHNRHSAHSVPGHQQQGSLPFPVVDDREEEDDEAQFVDADEYHRERTDGEDGDGLLTPGVRSRQRTASSRYKPAVSPSVSPTAEQQGSRLLARDGGRTQSGGVKGVSLEVRD